MLHKTWQVYVSYPPASQCLPAMRRAEKAKSKSKARLNRAQACEELLNISQVKRTLKLLNISQVKRTLKTKVGYVKKKAKNATSNKSND